MKLLAEIKFMFLLVLQIQELEIQFLVVQVDLTLLILEFFGQLMITIFILIVQAVILTEKTKEIIKHIILVYILMVFHMIMQQYGITHTITQV